MMQEGRETDFPCVVLVGNKSDKEHQIREVSQKEALDLADQLLAPYFEVSCVTGRNTEELWNECVRQYKFKCEPVGDKGPLPQFCFPSPTTTIRDDIQRLVNKEKYHDAVIVSDEWEKFKLIYIATNSISNFWVPRELWRIIVENLTLKGFFSQRYKIYCHKCILLTRFPTLMALIKEKDLNLELTQNFSFTALGEVISWIYSGKSPTPSLYEEILPIARKLELFNLIAICEARPVQSLDSKYSLGLITNAEALSDVQFTCEDSPGKVLYGHKAILSVRSIFFNSLFHSTPSVTCDLSGSYEANLAILKYLYEDEGGPMNLDLNLEVLRLVEKRHEDEKNLSLYFQSRIVVRLNCNTELVTIYNWVLENPMIALQLRDFVKKWVAYRSKVIQKNYPRLWALMPQSELQLMMRLQNWEVEDTKEKTNCLIS